MRKLGDKLWYEWSSLPTSQPEEEEIAGIFDGLTPEDGGSCVVFPCGRLFAVRRLLRLVSDLESRYRDSIKIEHTQKLHSRVTVCIDKKTLESILAVGRPSNVRCRKWGWMRGIWGSCGALYIPKTGYYLAMRVTVHSRTADMIKRMLKSSGLLLRARMKGDIEEITIRDQHQIVTFLSRLGFVKAPLSLEETAIYRLMRSRANKIVNCDSANINKTLITAQKQIKLIKALEMAGLMNKLPKSLLEVVAARKNSPSISLKELGQSLERPISKSTVEYRWQRLEDILQAIQEGDGYCVLGKSRC